MEFLLPDIGEGVAEGEIVKWHVKPGDALTEEQDFVEVMTDKATVMIPCPVTGTLEELLAQEGEVVPVHSAIARFGQVEGGEVAQHGHGAHGSTPTRPEQAPAKGHARSSHAGAAQVARAGVGGNGNGQAGVATLAAPAAGVLLTEARARSRATPATRRLARELRVDIHRVKASGPNGRVTRDDVERTAAALKDGGGAVAAPAAPAPGRGAPSRIEMAPAAAPAARPLPPSPAPGLAGIEGPLEERVPLRGVRRKIAEFLAHSKRTAAHYTYVEEVDVTGLVDLRQRMKARAEAQGQRITYLAFIVKAVTIALKKHPHLNCSLDDVNGEIVYKRYFNIGIAADTENGLVVPVLKHADRRSILEIAGEVSRLGEGARAGSLSAEDLQGGTFTITSAGHIGGLLATPILNWPEVAILGVHKIKKRPVVVDDQIVIRDIMYLSLSLDHRVVDGADAARFMNDVVRVLEDPELFILEGA